MNHADCCARLAKIAALCDGWAIEAASDEYADEWQRGVYFRLREAVRKLRAVLAEPGPAVPAHDIDRDALLDVLLDYDQNEYSTRQTADRILELVKHDA